MPKTAMGMTMIMLLRLWILLTIFVWADFANAQPIAGFTGFPLSGCSPLVVNFTNQSTGNPTGYSWTITNSLGQQVGTSVLENPSIVLIDPGFYTVKLVVSNAQGTDSLIRSNYITVFQDPVANFTATETIGCDQLTVQLLDLSSPGSAPIVGWLWDVNAGIAFYNQQNPFHTFTSPGSYPVSLLVVDANGCSNTHQVPDFITVSYTPIANFTGDPTQACFPPHTVNFTNFSTGNGTLNYLWNFGDGNTSASASPSHTYTNSGSFTVTLVATDAYGCADTMVVPNMVYIAPIVADFSTPNTVVCANSPVQFNDLSTGPVTNWSWDFGDGTSSNQSNPVKYYNTPGVYTVTLTASNGSNCSNTRTIPNYITVNPAPTADFFGTNLFGCSVPHTVNMTNQSIGATSYWWSFGLNQSTSTQTNPSNTYFAFNSYTVTLVATNNFGCTDTLVRPNYVNIIPPTANFTNNPATGCVPLEVNFSDLSQSGAPIVSWWWDFGTGNPGDTSNLPSPSFTYTNEGSYDVTLIVVNSLGCRDTVMIPAAVQAGLLPTAGFFANPLIACIGQTIQFTDTSILGTEWDWEFGDGSGSSQQNPVHIYQDTGTYDISLIVIQYGCEDTLIVPGYIIVNGPRAEFTFDHDCDNPYTIAFSDSSLMPDSWVWNFGGAGNSGQPNPTFTFPQRGVYDVSLIVGNVSTGCIDTSTIPISITDPVASFTVDTVTGCVPLTINFSSANSIDGSTFKWYFGTSDSSSAPNPVYTYTTPGNYDVTLIVYDIYGCSDTLTQTQIINVLGPLADFSATPLTGCVPLLVNFTDLSTPRNGPILTWTWNFGNTAVTSNAINPQHWYPSVGFFNISLTVTDSLGCSHTRTRNQYIWPTFPIPSFSADTIACTSVPFQFTGTSQGVGLQYFWQFTGPINDSATGPNPAILFTDPGYYSITLSVVDTNGCDTTVVYPNYLHVRDPRAGFVADTTFTDCPPLFVNFTDTSTNDAVAWYWDFGDGNFSTDKNPGHVYSSAGRFTVTLIITTAQGCQDTMTIPNYITVLGPNGTFSFSPLSGCAPLTVNFTATTTNTLNIVFDARDGNVAPVGSNWSHTYNDHGFYIPVVILSDSLGCVYSIPNRDTIIVGKVEANFTADTTVACTGDPICFTDLSWGFPSITNWSYNFGDGSTIGAPNPCHTYTQAGLYSVSLTVSNALGCDSTYVRPNYITIDEGPLFTLGPDVTICNGDFVNLSINSGASFLWTPSAGLSDATIANPVASPNQTTTYIGTGFSSLGCPSRDTITVEVIDKTIAAAFPDTVICVNSPVQLGVNLLQTSYRPVTYQWSPYNYLNAITIANPISTPRGNVNSITYSVIVQESFCEPDTAEVTVIVNPLPVITYPDDTVVVKYTEYVLLTTSNSPGNFFWSPIEQLTCSQCPEPTFLSYASDSLTVVFIDENGCEANGRFFIEVIEYCDDLIFVPNTFTPNNDGKNDILVPRYRGLQSLDLFEVYNRWGKLVFRTTNGGEGWDGTYKGKPLNSDVYVFYVEGICTTGQRIQKKGNVTLLR